MIEIIKGTWAAGETKTFAINGDRIEVLDAQYALDVFLMNSAGAQLSVMRDSEASFFSAPVGGFSTVQIYSAQAQFIRFFVGSGDAGTRRISSTVQVIDGARARTNAGVAFSGTQPVVNITGMYSQAQLKNAIGSGKNIIVNRIACSASAAANVYLAGDASNLATGGAGAANKRLGGPLSAAGAMRYGNIGTIQPPTALSSLFTLSVAAGIVAQWTPTEPIVLAPGWGLVASIDVINVNMTASFEWFEEAI